MLDLNNGRIQRHFVQRKLTDSRVFEEDMYETAKNLLRGTLLERIYKNYRSKKEIRDWINGGRPLPPPHRHKVNIIRNLASSSGASIFIETGTYRGDMVEAVRNLFQEVYSIELGNELFENAKERFALCANVKICHGDSGDVLGSILDEINSPCLFWLDGHYSAGVTAKGIEHTPVKRELDHIFRHPMAANHIILIDDARCFTGENDYPTIAEIREIAVAAGFVNFNVEDDIIRMSAP